MKVAKQNIDKMEQWKTEQGQNRTVTKYNTYTKEQWQNRTMIKQYTEKKTVQKPKT